MLEHRRFGTGVQCCGGLIENQNVGIAPHVGPRQRQLLPLPTGQLLPTRKPAPQLSGIAVLQTLDKRLGRALHRRLAPALGVIERTGVTHPEVFPDAELIADEILEDHPDSLTQRLFLPVLQITAVEQDTTLVRPVQTCQQLDQGGLA